MKSPNKNAGFSNSSRSAPSSGTSFINSLKVEKLHFDNLSFRSALLPGVKEGIGS